MLSTFFLFDNFFLDLRGKGGKGDKVANGGKKPEKKTPPPVQLRVEKGMDILLSNNLNLELVQYLLQKDSNMLDAVRFLPCFNSSLIYLLCLSRSPRKCYMPD